METLAFAPPNEVARFSASERELLFLLYRARGRTVRHQALWNALYSLRPDINLPNDETVKVFLSKARRKLKHHRIEAEWGVGYRLVPVPRVRLHFRPVNPQDNSSASAVTHDHQICSQVVSQ